MCQILKIFYEFKSTNLVTNLIRDLFLKHKSSLFTNDKIIPLSIVFKWLFCNSFKLVWLLITKILSQTPRMKLSKKFGYFPTCSLTDSQWEKNYASLWAAWATGYLFSSSNLCCMGRYQLVDLIITELEYHMIYYNSMPLISWNYGIQTGVQIL